ncbi:MAG: CAP domain-containing protein [Ekhidna sp.]|nr:CAP domain-containing protein [Ekhidna sp.]MBC6411327.1 CAP domain-containing protein [Ekhidna sp.]
MFKKIASVLLTVLLFSCGKDDDVISSIHVNLDVASVLSLVNDHRRAGATCGSERYSSASVIQWDDALAQAALFHSNDMQSNDYFSHTGRNGSNFSERVKDARFEGSPLGENIASGYSSEEAVVTAWIESPGHCVNIMNGSATHIGVARSGRGSLWTMVLGRKSD